MASKTQFMSGETSAAYLNTYATNQNLNAITSPDFKSNHVETERVKHYA